MTRRKPQVLIVDDEPYGADIAARLEREFSFDVVETFTEAQRRIEDKRYDLALLDIDLGDGPNGIDLLKWVRSQDMLLPAIMLTKIADMEKIVESISNGAFYYIIKGRTATLKELRHVAEKAIEHGRLRRAVPPPSEDEPDALARIAGVSPAIRSIKEQIAELADTDIKVLIEGETGTGKELVARAIHELGERADVGAFVPVCSAAIPETLAEAELFGVAKGGHAEAYRDRVGRFELADRGTLFLDEIQDLSPGIQAKLLRVLEDGTFERVGESVSRATHARIVSASVLPLDGMIQDGTFRPELYQRLAKAVIRIPPLRERREDIGPTAAALVPRAAAEAKRHHVTGISASAIASLEEHDWSGGNVRELLAVISRATLRTRGDTIQVEDLDFGFDYGVDTVVPPYKEELERMTRRFQQRYFSHLLRITRGNVRATAEKAGLHHTSVYDILKTVELESGDFKE
ncbi:MAG: response regulator [Candidatus Eisenbacteria bacterium]|nr:response regulator [Candidatus Eisenbacteria bacterium]